MRWSFKVILTPQCQSCMLEITACEGSKRQQLHFQCLHSHHSATSCYYLVSVLKIWWSDRSTLSRVRQGANMGIVFPKIVTIYFSLEAKLNKTIPGIPGPWVLSPVWTTECKKEATCKLLKMGSEHLSVWRSTKCFWRVKQKPLTTERRVCFLVWRVYKVHLLSLFREKCSLSSFSSAINQRPQWHRE